MRRRVVRPWCGAALNGVECSGVHIGAPAMAGHTGMQARSAVAASESRPAVDRVKGSVLRACRSRAEVAPRARVWRSNGPLKELGRSLSASQRALYPLPYRPSMSMSMSVSHNLPSRTSQTGAPHAARNRLASWTSFCWTVTRLAWIAQRFASWKRFTRNASAASCSANRACDCH